MNSSVVFCSRWISISKSVTAACTDTSSAETGSSATTIRASPAKARAMPTRCFCPPDSWRGIRVANSRGSFTRSSSSSMRCQRSFSLLPILKISKARTIWRPTVIEGLSVSNGFWNTIWMSATFWVVRFSIGTSPMPSPSSVIVPSVAVSSPMSTLANVDLPQPDSPTIASVSLSRASKLSVSLAFTTLVSPPPNMALAAT